MTILLKRCKEHEYMGAFNCPNNCPNNKKVLEELSKNFTEFVFKKPQIIFGTERKMTKKVADALKNNMKKIIETRKKKSEDQVVKTCNAYLKKNGWYPHTMFTGGIPIGGGRYASNPCKGIPDCIAFNPTLRKLLWIEYKKEEGGVLSTEQKIWHERLKRTDQLIFVVNSLKSLKQQLEESGLCMMKKDSPLEK